MLKIFKRKKRRFFFYSDELYFFVRDNLHFHLDRDYSSDDVEVALQYAADYFWKILNELDKENKENEKNS